MFVLTMMNKSRNKSRTCITNPNLEFAIQQEKAQTQINLPGESQQRKAHVTCNKSS